MPSVNWKVNARATEARWRDSEPLNRSVFLVHTNGEVFLKT